MVPRMFTSAECLAKAASASAKAATLVTDSAMRTQFEELAVEWRGLAVSALAQEVLEADIIERQDSAVNAPWPD